MYLYLLILTFSLVSVLTSLIILRDRFGYLKDINFICTSTIIIAIPFLIWDYVFTKKGVWGFSDEYLIGFNIFNLPIEEILFFFIIPFCSVFIFKVIDQTAKFQNSKLTNILVALLSLSLIGIGLMNLDKFYTSVAFTSAGVLLTLNVFFKTPYLTKFFLSFLLILIPFFIVNGLLTSGLDFISENPVVWYNDNENFSFRLISIPIEDIPYGFTLVLGNINIYKFLQQKSLASRQLD